MKPPFLPRQINRLRRLSTAISALRSGQPVRVLSREKTTPNQIMAAAEFLFPDDQIFQLTAKPTVIFAGDMNIAASLINDLPIRDLLVSIKAADEQTQDCLDLTIQGEILPLILVWPDDTALWPDPITTVHPDDWQNRDQDEADTLNRISTTRVPLAGAEDSRIILFRSPGLAIEHLALLIGAPEQQKSPLVRLHSQCVTGDLLGSLRCDCGPQLRGAVSQLGKETLDGASGGIILYLAHEGRAIGLVNKLRAYQLQDDGLDTVDANLALGFAMDNRYYRVAAAMLKQLGINNIRLMTNNPDKLAALEQAGISVAERLPHIVGINSHNHSYIEAKRSKSGHFL
jgi:GTP cyclohydrolase II